jgi:hypothetical protein
MAKKGRIIKTHEDLQEFATISLSKLKTLQNYDLEFDKNLFIIKLRITGVKYDATITPPIMEYLLAVQKGIYALYRQYAGHRLSREDKKRLEIVVHVEKGSSEIVFSILEQAEAIKEAIKAMTGDQVFALGITAIITAGIVSLGKKLFDHLDKKHERQIEFQKQQAQTDKDKHLFEMLAETTHVVSRTRRDSMASLSKINDVAAIEYGGEVIEQKDLHERVAVDRKQEEPDVSTVVGMYRITRLHFNFEANSAKADMYDTRTNDVITSLEIQPRSVLDGTYAVLKKAQKKQDVKLRIIVRKKGNRIIKATLDKIL